MLGEALRIMGVGMATVFGLLIVLYFIIKLLMRIRQSKTELPKE